MAHKGHRGPGVRVGPRVGVEVVVIRDGGRKVIQVTLSVMDEPRPAIGDRQFPRPAGLGLGLQDLTPDIAKQLGFEEDSGVVITHVEPDSSADHAGLQRGDVILEVQGVPTSSAQALSLELESMEESTLLLIRRDKATLFIPLKRKS